MANLQQKLPFQSGVYDTITDADIKSLKSLHTLFHKYLDHMLVKSEQNHIVKYIQNFEVFGLLRKCRRHFGRRFYDKIYCSVVKH